MMTVIVKRKLVFFCNKKKDLALAEIATLAFSPHTSASGDGSSWRSSVGAHWLLWLELRLVPGLGGSCFPNDASASLRLNCFFTIFAWKLEPITNSSYKLKQGNEIWQSCWCMFMSQKAATRLTRKSFFLVICVPRVSIELLGKERLWISHLVMKTTEA